MLKLGELLGLWVCWIMVSIMWITQGFHWGWVVGAWVICFLLNKLHAGAIKRRTKNIQELSRARMNKAGHNEKPPSNPRPEKPPAAQRPQDKK